MVTKNSARGSIRRSYGGVYVVPLFTSPFPCGGHCLYCPEASGLPKSYVPNASTMAAKRVAFSPVKQLAHTTEILEKEGTCLPMEIIILGGSFSSLEWKYRENFISRLYGSLSDSGDNDSALIENARFRCSILTVESRPDQINDQECEKLRALGISKVELGVQHLNDDVLGTCKRGHGADVIKEATRLLKNHGFKIGYHVMLGLPGSKRDLDEEMLGEQLWLPEYAPDFLKLYPCVLLKNRELQPRLHYLFDSGAWSPPKKDYFLYLLKVLVDNVPATVRISRVQRFFQEDKVIGGFFRGIREDSVGLCRCIRCREAGKSAPKKLLPEFGQERIRVSRQDLDVCLEVIDDAETLLGLARIRLGKEGSAILRELHVYGRAAPIGQIGPIQGRGLGMRLLRLVENYALRADRPKLLVNAAHGAKPFFRKADYSDKIGGFLGKILAERKAYNKPVNFPEDMVQGSIYQSQSHTASPIIESL